MEEKAGKKTRDLSKTEKRQVEKIVQLLKENPDFITPTELFVRDFDQKTFMQRLK